SSAALPPARVGALLRASPRKARRPDGVSAGQPAGRLAGPAPAPPRRKRRDDEQPARDGEPGEIKRQSNAAPAREGSKIATEAWNRRSAEGGGAEIDGGCTQQHGTDHGRQQNDASGGEPGRKPGADRDRYREDRETGGHHLFVAAEHVLHQRRHQR